MLFKTGLRSFRKPERKEWASGAFKYPHQKPWNCGLKVLNYELIQASVAAQSHCDWRVSSTHPPVGGALSVCTSVSPPPLVSATVMLSQSLCVCRQEVTQCLTESRQRDKLIRQQTHREGRREKGEGRRRRRGWGGGSTQNKTDKRQNAKTPLRTLEIGLLLHSEQPSFFRHRLLWNAPSQSVPHTNEDQWWWPAHLTSYQSH